MGRRCPAKDRFSPVRSGPVWSGPVWSDLAPIQNNDNSNNTNSNIDSHIIGDDNINKEEMKSEGRGRKLERKGKLCWRVSSSLV